MMENAYGIGVKNRYELFYDEDVDPLEIIREREEAKEKRKIDKTLTKDKMKNLKPGKTPNVTAVKKPKENTTNNSPKPIETVETANKSTSKTKPFSDMTLKNPRGYFDSKDSDERRNFRNKEEHQHNSSFTREHEGELKRSRGGFRGRGRPRGRGNFSNNRPPRRDFDRRSGNDKVDNRVVENKDGAVSNNWSDMQNILSNKKAEPDFSWDADFESSGDKPKDFDWCSTSEANALSPCKETPVEKAVENTTIESVESKENQLVEDHSDEVMKEMTLDEWKKEQEAKRAVPKYNLRKPGEGEDGNQWKKLYVLKKKAKENGEEEDYEDDEDVDDEELGRRGRHRQLIDIQINFNDSHRGRGRARGGRGSIAPRSGSFVANKDVHREERREPPAGPSIGRSYRSMKKNKSNQQSAPRVDDWNDFPSLVTS